MPTLVRQTGATTTDLQWIVDAYNLVFAALVLIAGSMSDRLGRKGMLLAGLGVFSAASLAGSFCTTAHQLIGVRAVMGLGAAMMFPATLSLLTNVFTARRERAAAIGLWGATTGVGIATGPIIGGWLLEHYWWGSVFLFMVPGRGRGRRPGRLGRAHLPGPAYPEDRLARPDPVRRRDGRAGPRDHPGTRLGLELAAGHRHPGHRRCPAGRLRGRINRMAQESADALGPPAGRRGGCPGDLRARLEAAWSIISDGSQPVICGPVADQAVLHGLLNKVCGLELALIALRRLAPE